MLGVGATSRDERRSAFSNFNGQGGSDWVEVSAPGENIVSALPGGRYGMWSGTSMAAPIVTGIAALVKAKNPPLQPNQFIGRIKETAVDIRYGSNPQIRLRRVDAWCAVMNMQECSLPPVPANDAGFENFGFK
jgi:subtilisin family serine protease